MEHLPLDDGTLYSGEVQDGLPHGEGTLSSNNGKILKGSFSKGRVDGSATYEIQGLKYEGSIKGVLAHGLGVMKSDSGVVAGKFQ